MSGLLKQFQSVPPAEMAPEADRLRLALDISRQGTWSFDPRRGTVRMDARMRELWDRPPEPAELELATALELIHPEDRAEVERSIATALDPAGTGRYATTYRVIHESGRVRWINTIGQATFAGDGARREAVEVIGTARDVTEDKRAEALLVAQRQLLEGIARGEPLEHTLDGIVGTVEEQEEGGAVAAIMLVDAGGNCLRHGAARQLPDDYLAAVDGIGIAPGVGTCAAAAARGEAVFTPDFETDAAWDGLRQLPLGLGLRGAWSMPIRDSRGTVLGTIGTYFREPRLPEEREIRIVEVLAEIAALAIEQHAAREKLRRNAAEISTRQKLFDAVADNTPDLIYVFDLEHRFTYANPSLLGMWGKTWDEAIGKRCIDLGYEKWHAEMHDREIDEVVRTKRPIKGEVPFEGAYGRRIYEYIFTPVFDDRGEVQEVSGTTRDVTDRKHAEERAKFLSKLTRHVARLDDEREIVEAAVEATGRFLRAHRCYFIECDAESGALLVGPNWRRDEKAASLEGTRRLFDFGDADWWHRYASGDFAVTDVREDPLTREHAANYEAVDVISYAAQPYRGEGPSTVALGATDDVPREWTRDELSVLESVIARVWPLVERVRSERALRQSEEHLRLVANHAPAMISYVDHEHRYRFANDHYFEWFGLRPDEMHGRTVREVLGEENYAEREPHIRRVLEGEPIRQLWKTRHRKLGLRDLDVSLVPDVGPEGTVRGYYVLGFDITEHKLAQESLARRGDRLRLLWESARILLTTDDPHTMLQRLFEELRGHLEVDAYFNYTAAGRPKRLHLRSWHGISEDEAAAISRIHPGDGPCGEVAASRAPVVRPAPTGVQDLPFGLRAYAGYPLLSDGQLLGTLAFASRTRDSFLDDELEFLETISHYVTAAYVRLELVANLREGDRRKDEFLAVLAHELRNPLAPIRTGIEVLRHSLGHPAKMENVIGIIERQTAQMVRLIDDLIDVSRVTRGKLELRKERIDLKSVLPAAVEAVQPLIDRAGHQLEVSLPDEPLPIDGDSGRLAQVFSNLLNNAARYTPEGGRIRLRVERAGGRSVAVSVLDNGEGIEPAMQEKIFEVFTQANRTGKSAAEGLGIGLTLVRLLVQKHGGTITVESEGLGKGSEFRVTLPLLETPEAGDPAEAGPASREAPPSASCPILVVDDGVSAADMLALFFKFEGFDTRTAYDGEEALRIAAEYKPRIVFLDIGMPRMDGCEVARRLREVPGCEKATLIALTGWGQESDRKKTREAGFDHHLVKPVEPGMLRELLGRLEL